ncbi:hypothetical protein Gotur_003796 [Gossypium turneri]
MNFVHLEVLNKEICSLYLFGLDVGRLRHYINVVVEAQRWQPIRLSIKRPPISHMLLTDDLNDTKDLYLFINSPNEWVIPGVAIYDTMQFVQPDVHTICMGLAASMGSFFLVGGEITKNLAFPHARCQ